MLSGVFHLHEQEARQVMTPIPAVVTVDLSEDVETALRRCIDRGHTRLLVTEDENQDRIRGVVHATGLARRLLDGGRGESIEPLVREAPIVPETKPLDDLLAELQRAAHRARGRRRRVRARRRDRHGRGHRRGGRRRDHRRDRPARRRRAPAARRRLVRRAGTCRSPTSRLRHRAAGRQRRLQLDRRARLQRPRPAAQARRQGQVNGYELRVESVRENRIVRCASASATRGRASQSRAAELLTRNAPAPRWGSGRRGSGRRCDCEICVAHGVCGLLSSAA